MARFIAKTARRAILYDSIASACSACGSALIDVAVCRIRSISCERSAYWNRSDGVWARTSDAFGPVKRLASSLERTACITDALAATPMTWPVSDAGQ